MTLLYAQTNDTQCPIPIQEFEIFENILEKKKKKKSMAHVCLFLGEMGYFMTALYYSSCFYFSKFCVFFLLPQITQSASPYSTYLQSSRKLRSTTESAQAHCGKTNKNKKLKLKEILQSISNYWVSLH